MDRGRFCLDTVLRGLMVASVLCMVFSALSARCDDTEPVIGDAGDVPLDPATVDEQDVFEESDEEVDEEAAAYERMELFTEALLHIKEHYVEERTFEEISSGALHGMLHALDPHSLFLEPEEYSDMKENTSGKFSGIGIHIGMRDRVLTVISPIEDTPAFKKGLQSGDRILEIEGVKTMGISLREAVNKLRGEKGTKVTITIQRNGEDQTREVEIVRDDITVPSVKGARIIRDGIGYVRITQFATPSAEALSEALAELQAEGMDALVLDVRSNPGGLLRSAIDVSEQFLSKGDLIVMTRGRPGVHDEVETRADGTSLYTDIPIAVLVNAGSASASEIVAGALHDNGRAVVVGDTTFGKGSVQSVIPLTSDKRSALRLTIARYYTPSGRVIQDKGIDPDIRVYVTPEEWRKIRTRRAHIENPSLYTDEEKENYADVVDPQLRRAVDVLQAVKIFRR